MFSIDKYLGLEWKADSFCCGDFVQAVLCDEFGIALPAIRYTGNPRDAAKILATIPQRNLFKQIDSPIHLCVVEMKKFRRADHVGICVDVGGVLHIAHCEPGSGVSLTDFHRIKDDYEIVGYYEFTG